MDSQKAKLLALQKLAQLESEIGEELMLSENSPKSMSDGWYFFYNTRAAIESGDMRKSLAGNGPIHISNRGEVSIKGSSESF